MIRVDQIIITASPGDAITSMAVKLRTRLRTRWQSDIYANTVLPSLRGDVRELHELPVSTKGGTIVYHSSYGEPAVTDVLLRRRERIVLAYHNFTPPEHFMAWSPEFARGVEWGRHELRLLRERAVRVIADSTYNADDLLREGYTDVDVIPAGIDPGRLRSLSSDFDLVLELERRFPAGYVVAIAQLLPHKRIERLIEAVHVVSAVHRLDIGLVVVGSARILAYSAALEQHARRLHVDRIWFTGSVQDRALATIVGRSIALVSSSEHEGLSLPPVEAMALGVPIIVRGTGAVPETVGDGGLVLPERGGVLLLAEAIAEVITNERTRCRLIARGLERAAQLAGNTYDDQFVAILDSLD